MVTKRISKCAPWLRMGCICLKGGKGKDDNNSHRTKSSKNRLSVTRKDEVVVAISDAVNSGSRQGTPISTIKQQDNVGAVEGDRSREGAESVVKLSDLKPVASVANGFVGQHVTAGWPSWLVSVAGEAIKGWAPRRLDSFEKLDKIGQGTYSSVYRARDLETQKIVALKKVRFVNMDPESVRFMAREIHILRKLDHPNVIKLEGIIASQKSSSLYLVFEYMEHDLTGIAARPGVKFTEPEVKCYMRQILEGLAHCHNRGVLHRDIKGSNILIDNNGILRIADFGLASFFDPDQKQPLTSRVVTLWYRPPELLFGATEYDVAVDLWSVGCILAELFAGKPIMPGRTEVEQMHKIFKLCGSPSDDYWKKSKLPHATIFKPQRHYKRRLAETFNDFPPSALALLDVLLAIDPEKRGTAASALESEFFTTKPFACDPSSLPKYPASKEYDAKLREDEARRQRAEATQGPEKGESKNMLTTDANMEIKKRRNKQKYSVKVNDLSAMTIDPLDIGKQNAFAHSTMHSSAAAWNNKMNQKGRMAPARTYSVRVRNGPQLKTQRSFGNNSGNTDFSNFPSSVAPRITAGSQYNGEIAEPQEKLNKSLYTLEKDEITADKDSTSATGNKNKRIHYSGPLMPSGGNMEDLLKEHERHIQEAVRKARVDKVHSKNNF